jgi:hypothetical protein
LLYRDVADRAADEENGPDRRMASPERSASRPTQAAGLSECLGTPAKSVGVGNAARNGLLSALLAAKDFIRSPARARLLPCAGRTPIP